MNGRWGWLITLLLLVCWLPALSTAEEPADPLKAELERLKLELPFVLSAHVSLAEKQAYVERVLNLRQAIEAREAQAREAQARMAPGGQADESAAPVFVLTEIRVKSIEFEDSASSARTEHAANALGYLQRYRDAVSERLEMVRCTDCPRRIELGEAFRFAAEAHARYDSERYRCDGKWVGDRWSPELVFDAGLAFNAVSDGPKLHFPDCNELGIKAREVKVADNLPPMTTIDPVGLTREAAVTLQVDLRLQGEPEETSDGETVFHYTASYGGSGTLIKEKRLGSFSVVREKRSRDGKTQQRPQQLMFSFNHLLLVYTRQRGDQPSPLDATAFTLPAALSRPPLSSTPVVTQTETPPEQTGGQTETPQSGADEALSLPDLVGLPYRDAVAAIEAAGLIALPPELGSEALDAASVGHVAQALAAAEGVLRRGDGVRLILYGEPVNRVVVPQFTGLAVGEAADAVQAAGLVPEFVLDGTTRDEQAADRVSRQDPAPGVEVAAGSGVRLTVLSLEQSAIRIPDLQGMGVAEAKQALSALGLEMSPLLGEQPPASQAQVGQVYRQSPEPGVEVSGGNGVKVWVYGELVAAQADALAGGVPFFTIPDIPEHKRIWARPKGRGQQGIQVVPGQRIARDADGFLAPGGRQREFVLQTDAGGFEITVSWLEPTDRAESIGGPYQRVVQSQSCRSVAGAEPVFSPSKPIFVESGGKQKILMQGLASITLVGQSGQALVAIKHSYDGYLEKHKQAFFRIARALLAEVEPYARPCATSVQTEPVKPALHLCKDPAIRDDSYALKYTRGSGGGQATYFIRQNTMCHRQGYSKIQGGRVDYYECRDKDFADCYLKSSLEGERKQLEAGVYQLIFKGGKDWWTIHPNQ